MRTDILKKFPSSPVRVYVVWFDMLAADSRTLVDRHVLNDRRVTNFYDPKRVAGLWFGQHTAGSVGIVWDAYYLYGPDATWGAEPAPLVSSGGPVIFSTADLASAFGSI